MKFETFKVKGTDQIVRYPAHYENHPVFGETLERYTPGESEEDKVVVENHEIPVDQRIRRTAKPKDADDAETGEKE